MRDPGSHETCLYTEFFIFREVPHHLKNEAKNVKTIEYFGVVPWGKRQAEVCQIFCYLFYIAQVSHKRGIRDLSFTFFKFDIILKLAKFTTYKPRNAGSKIETLQIPNNCKNQIRMVKIIIFVKIYVSKNYLITCPPPQIVCRIHTQMLCFLR